MRRIMFVLVFMIGICLSGESKESGIKLIPVYEKTFEDTIVDVIFDTVTVSLSEAKAMGWKEEAFSEEEKAKGKVTITYPCVLITKEEIRFLDERGKEKKSINRIVKGVKWEGKQGVKIGEGVIKVRKSKEGGYLGVVIPREGSTLDGTMKGDLVMYSKGGREMWRLEGVYLSDGDIVPSPNGEYVIGLPPAEYPAGAPYIYTNEGMEELKVREWDNGWKNGYAVEDFDFTEDGEYFVIGVYNFPVRDSGFIVEFNKWGKEVWKRKLLGSPEDVKFLYHKSPYVIVAIGKDENSVVFQLFHLNGDEVWLSQDKIPLAEYKYYLEGKDSLLIVFGVKGRKKVYHNKIFRIDFKSGKCSVIYKGRFSERIQNIIYVAQGKIYLSFVRGIYSLYQNDLKPIYLLDKRGNIKYVNLWERYLVIVDGGINIFLSKDKKEWEQ